MGPDAKRKVPQGLLWVRIRKSRKALRSEFPGFQLSLGTRVDKRKVDSRFCSIGEVGHAQEAVVRRFPSWFEVLAEPPETNRQLTLLDGVGPKTAYALQQAGIGDVADLAEASPLQVAFAAQVSEKRARIWIAGAKDLLT